MQRALTPPQVADYLQIGQRTALDLIRAGEIPARKVGGQWRVSPEALEEYLRGDIDHAPLSPGDFDAVREGIEQIRAGETVPLEVLEQELDGR